MNTPVQDQDDFWTTEDRTIEVFSAFNEAWTVREFAAILRRAVASIPVEFHDTAKVELAGESATYLRIFYTRPWTAAEIEAEQQRQKTWHMRAVQQEKAEYERLKAKYEERGE